MGTAATILLPQISHPGRSRPGRRAFRRRLKFLCAAPLASALAGKKRFPGLLAMFSRLGEQTGQLPLMLDRAANQLGAEVQRRAMQIATLLEPLLIV